MTTHQQYLNIFQHHTQCRNAKAEYVPAAHVKQVVAELADASDPATHPKPAGLLTHVLAPNVEYLPGIQLKQLSEPREALYLPEIHLVQTPPLEPMKPRMQAQLLAVLLPANQVERAGQLMQTLDDTAPVTVEYVL